jgi:flagellar hook-associated protein 2
MSGVTSGVGLFSGIDRNSIIQQLLSIDARAKTPVQRRITSLQGLSAAYLDVSSKLGSLRTAAQAFRVDKVFDFASATTSNESVATATASTGAPSGEYRVTVGRLASTQQMMSRAFADDNVTGLGLSELVYEGAQGRLDSETRLSDMRGGLGVQRGSIQIRDGSGATATIDLSRATSINDVLSAINGQTSVRVRARIDDTSGTSYASGDGLIIEDLSGGTGQLSVANFGGTTTASDLGIAGAVNAGQRLDNNPAVPTTSAAATAIRGKRINVIGTATGLRGLNDGLGVGFNRGIGAMTEDFTVTAKNGSTFNVDLGDVYDAQLKKTASAVTTIGEAVQRFNDAAIAANVNVRAAVNDDGSGLKLTDSTGGGGSLGVAAINGSTAAVDLGIAGSVAGNVLVGSRLTAKINSVQAARLRAGGGFVPQDNDIDFTLRDGTSLSVLADVTGSVSDMIASINNASGNNGRVTASLDSSANRMVLTDNTSGGGSLNISGALATALEVDGSFTSGKASSGRMQRQYVSANTQLSALNYGRGIGTGTFEITASNGLRRTVTIGSGDQNVQDLVNRINSNNAEGGLTLFSARVNDSGDGVIIEDSAGGANKLSIKDNSGAVARNLFLAGTAESTGSNFINGSYERRIALDPADTLQQALTKINNAGLNVRASVLRDGSSTPFRLSLSSRSTGSGGAFTLDAVGQDLGLTTTTAGRDALVFYGSDDTTAALAVESSSNNVTGAIPGVSLELKGVSSTPVTISVSADTTKITEKVKAFVDAYNALIKSIDDRSTYDADAQRRGVLLGDSVTSELRGVMQNLWQSRAQGVTGQFSFLFEAGIRSGTKGQLTFNEDAFRAALERDPRGVADLFGARTADANASRREISPGVFVNETVAGTVTSRGVMEIMADTLERYTRSTDGVLTRSTRTIDDQIKANNARITTIDARIASRRTRLERQFIAMESAIGRLQGQQSSLSSIRPTT